MNYRHHFHAGNFADLVKHAVLLAVLDRLLRRPEPLLVVDTHGGAGGYELSGEGEAAAAARLRDDGGAPPVFAPLRAAIGTPSSGAGLFYPGSPLLVAERLRPVDRFVVCELREDDREALARRLGPRGGVEVLQEDGYATAAARLKPSATRALVLVDPPYERADDYDRVLELLASARRSADTTVLVWLPLKDLETFDRFLRGVEALQPAHALVGEVRLRPLTDPMRLNGCAVLLIGQPEAVDEVRQACEWVADTFGERGARGAAWPL